MNFKKIKYSLALSCPAFFLVNLFSLNSALAADCYPAGSAFIYNHEYSFNSTQNYPGYSPPWKDLSRGGTYSVSGACANVIQNTYFTFKPATGLTSAGSSDGAQWFDVPNNDYLQVAMKVYIAGNRKTFFDVPQSSISNLCNGTCGNFYGTGGQVKVKLRIKKKFVGQSFLVNRDIGYVYAASSANDTPSRPIVIIRLNAVMTVPQSCSFDVGDVIEFDFGSIPSSAFSGGAGTKAQGVNVITKNVGIECKNIDAQQMLSARLEVANFTNNMIISDNPDVGFQLADVNDTVLIPNNINSFIPFRLDENARSNFILKSWPVSITGQIPKAGPVAAQGHIRIDFQ
ncbi:type 1 fimbria D-mannose specific adhesin FimH [Acinetobacter apis]|uniref:Minor fimbrial subunit n=1 Tax=Acinetobacter apis TaxID=1229165 RepID=A0A217EDK6_9GAMM|nr:fimbrial protein [Acinetobacter apis]SNQ28387.1 minor fimbrial subunit [Acinetobacter apis]